MQWRPSMNTMNKTNPAMPTRHLVFLTGSTLWWVKHKRLKTMFLRWHPFTTTKILMRWSTWIFCPNRFAMCQEPTISNHLLVLLRVQQLLLIEFVFVSGWPLTPELFFPAKTPWLPTLAFWNHNWENLIYNTNNTYW